MRVLSSRAVMRSSAALPEDTAATDQIVPKSSFLGSLLCRRRSERVFSGEPIPQDSLERMLVDTAGGVSLEEAITEDGEAFEQLLRTIPQGGAICSVRTHLILPKSSGDIKAGLYHFCHQTNRLHRINKVFAPEMIYTAFPHSTPEELGRVSAAFVISANIDHKLYKYKTKGAELCYIEAGCALQNLSLSAEDVGVHGYAVAGFVQDFLCQLFDLSPPGESVCVTYLAGMPRSCPQHQECNE